MLKPFFPFYGSKWRIAKLYPAPQSDLVVEPFAGSACYSLYWEPPNVALIDLDPVIVGIWDYLIRTPESEILALPDLAVGQNTDDLSLCQEAKWLVGFWINRGSSSPKNSRTAFSSRTDKAQLIWGERARQRIASQQSHIRHWSIFHKSYADLGNIEATWFIDPPYTEKGYRYVFNKIDYPTLATWSKERLGRVIVCENPAATWLPFTPLITAKTTRGTSNEGCWTNAYKSVI